MDGEGLSPQKNGQKSGVPFGFPLKQANKDALAKKTHPYHTRLSSRLSICLVRLSHGCLGGAGTRRAAGLSGPLARGDWYPAKLGGGGGCCFPLTNMVCLQVGVWSPCIERENRKQLPCSTGPIRILREHFCTASTGGGVFVSLGNQKGACPRKRHQYL